MLRQEGLFLDKYHPLYEKLIPESHELRYIINTVDFSFIYDELKINYCRTNGRNAVSPIILFKYLILKLRYKLSDEDVVKRSLYDLSFKFFLGFNPEETDLIDPSLLTVFRRDRLKDLNIIDLLVGETVNIAIAKGLIKSKTMIVDATHTTSYYNCKSPMEALMDYTKNIRKSIYKIDETLKATMPKKPADKIGIEDYMAYCLELCDFVKSVEKLNFYTDLQEKVNYLKEIVEDNLKELELSKEAEAAVGHKGQDHKFFGFKTHIGMSGEGIITAATVTTGEKPDGKELEDLVNKTKANGVEVDAVLGDAAYASKDNIEFIKEGEMELIARLNGVITNGNRKGEDEFEYNKDADTMACPAGHLAKYKHYKKEKDKNDRIAYYFDVEKCKQCPLKEGCYKQTKTKTYTITIMSQTHKEQAAFQETEYFKERIKERYKIEQKNADLKNNLGYRTTQNLGLLGMTIQAATTLFVANMKRIKVLESKKQG